MGPHGGGVQVEAAEEPGRVEGASIAGWEGTRRSEKVKVSEEAVRRKGGGGGPRTEDGLRMERRRSPRESRGRLRQVGRAQGEVRKLKCQRRHYQPGVHRLRNL
jgi:hypothetical protein